MMDCFIGPFLSARIPPAHEPPRATNAAPALFRLDAPRPRAGWEPAPCYTPNSRCIAIAAATTAFSESTPARIAIRT